MSRFSFADKRLRIAFIVLVTLFFVEALRLYPPKALRDTHQLDHNSLYAANVAGISDHSPLNNLESDKPSSLSHGLDPSKVAVIIDTVIQPRLFPLLLHFSAVLGPSWPIHVYTSEAGVKNLSASAPLAALIKIQQIKLITLPKEVTFPNVEEYSSFLTSHWIWDQLAPAEHILIFQPDSILCSRSPKRVDDFLEWDFVGAPIVRLFGSGYNGGLSLRKRSSTLRIIDSFKWTWPDPEDQWYYARLVELQEKDRAAGKNATIMLPPEDVAKTFAVETIDYPYPVGIHQPRRFKLKEEVSLEDYCPEFVLCLRYGVDDKSEIWPGFGNKDEIEQTIPSP